MGLDMYLKGKKHNNVWIKDEEKMNDEEKAIHNFSKENFTGLKVQSIEFALGYWRKANAIHKWFVKNVQDDTDDCEEYWVSSEKLIELKDLCEKVLINKDKAPEWLAAQTGFFFGSQDYDEWYFKDLESTVEIIDKTLEAQSKYGLSIYYQSSW